MVKKKAVIIGLFLLFISACLVVFYIFSKPSKVNLSQTEKEKLLSNLLGRKVDLSGKEGKTGNTQYKGKYVEFSYPAKAIIFTNLDKSFASSSAFLDAFSYDIKNPRIIFSMSVLGNELGLSSIDDYSGVKYRSLDGSYKEDDILLNNDRAKVFTRKGYPTSEKTVFLLREKKIFSLSITGNDLDEVNKIYSLLIRSINFPSESASDDK